MKKSDLVSVSVLVKDALEFFNAVPFLDLSSTERLVVFQLSDVLSHLNSLTFLPHD